MEKYIFEYYYCEDYSLGDKLDKSEVYANSEKEALGKFKIKKPGAVYVNFYPANIPEVTLNLVVRSVGSPTTINIMKNRYKGDG